MSFDTTGWDVREGPGYYRTSSTEDGGGGGFMPIWNEDRQTQLTTLFSAPMANESVFPTPSGFTSNGWDRSEFAQEQKAGVVTRGRAQDGTEMLAGMVGYKVGETTLSETNVTGPFTLAAAPFPGVSEGANSSLSIDQLEFYWAPTFAGIDYTSSDTDKYHLVEYSAIEGHVYDANGDPVENAALQATGTGASTDRRGYYQMLAPGGTTVTITGLHGTESHDRTVQDNTVATLDFQFSGILIKVRTPEYDPIVGASVEIDGRQYTTGKSGNVLLPTSGLGVEHNVRVFDSDLYTDTLVAPSTGGSIASATVGPPDSDFGTDPTGGQGQLTTAEIYAVDEETNNPIRNASVTEMAYTLTATTDRDGIAAVVCPPTEDGATTVKISDQSNRYYPETEEVTLDGTKAEITARLAPREQITNV